MNFHFSLTKVKLLRIFLFIICRNYYFTILYHSSVTLTMEIEATTAKSAKIDHSEVNVFDPSNAWSQHNVQFYISPPQETVSLMELRNLAVMRQKVLTTVESAGLRHPKHSNDHQRELEFALRQIDFKIAITTMNSGADVKMAKNTEKEFLQYRRADYVSHFILRLAYCSSSDLRQWFIQQEVDLFRFRFSSETVSSVKNFLQLYGIPTELVPVDSEEYAQIEPIMKELFPGRTAPVAAEEPEPKTDIFKVYFTEATDLVRHRKVFIRNGYAYVPYRELTSVVVGRFRSNLSRALAAMSKHSNDIQEDYRLQAIVKSVVGNGSSNQPATTNETSTTITADMVETLATESFPPCMRMACKHLHTKHHLKHNGRMQLGLFLKSVGLSMEESLKFWKKEFAPAVDADKFEKQYAYNIRHNYGKEGKRVDYTAYNCMKIVNLPPPGPGDCHGCPFKIMDATILQQNLENWGIHSEHHETILNLAQSHQYDRACSRFFEFQHGIPEGSLNRLISHPHEFFDESRKLRLHSDKTENGQISDAISQV